MKVLEKNKSGSLEISQILSAGIKKGVEKRPTLTVNQLIHWLKMTKGTVMLGLSTRTRAKMRKTNNPYPVIYKSSKFVGISGASYLKAVNKTLDNFGEKTDFKIAPRQWGEWVEGAEFKVVVHDGKYYLRVQSTARQRLRSKPIVTYWDESNNQLNYDDIEKWLVKPASSAKQEASGLNKVEQVQVREFEMDSIKLIRIMGVTYKLVA